MLKNINYPSLNGFNFMIKRSILNRENHIHEIDLHSHPELEIYINLSGDVSFLVENRLYPVERGDIIISRPGEYHHCVYRSEKEHNLFWILLESDKNANIFNFLLKDLGSNLISPDKKTKEKIIEICNTLMDEKLSDFDRYYYLFTLIMLIKSNLQINILSKDTLPQELNFALDYIDSHISENIKISDIAKSLYISESTLERRFKKHLDMKPLEFIHKKKMLFAAEQLRNGESVLNAGLSVGFSDVSYFIGVFKRFYGITPYQYKKNAQQN